MRRLMLCAAALLLLAACAGPGESERPDVSPNTDSSAPVTPSQEPVTSDDPLQLPNAGPVYVDWSKLDSTPAQGAQYSRWYEGYTDQLLPVEGGYGEPLVPFVGVKLDNNSWGWTIDLYGLATVHGTVVCDPVYDSISAAGSYYDYATEQRAGTDSFLLLYQTIMEDGVDEYGYPVGQRLFAVAARDGSWVLDGAFAYSFALKDGRLLLVDADEMLWFCNIDGTLERSPLRERPSDLWGDWWWEMGGFFDGVACMSAIEGGEWVRDRYTMANALTGEVKVFDGFSHIQFWGMEDLLAATDAGTGWAGLIDLEGNWVVEPQYTWVDGFDGSYAQVRLLSDEPALIDRAGEVVLTSQGESLWHWNGYYLDCTWSRESQTTTVHAVYNKDLKPLPDHPLNGKELTTSYGTPAAREGDLWTIWDGDTEYTVRTDAHLNSYDHQSGRAVFYSEAASTEGLYDFAAQKWIIPLGKYDSVTDYGPVYYGTSLNGPWSSGDVLDRDGNFIVHADEYPTVENDLILLRDGDYYGWVDLHGNWMFRWPVQTNSD